MERGDLEQVVNALVPIVQQAMDEAVGKAVAERMEEVYGVLEEMREQLRETVGVLDGNDHAIIAELRKVQGMTPAEVLTEAGRSWERFIIGEAKMLGMKVVKEKKVEKIEVRGDEGGEGEVGGE